MARIDPRHVAEAAAESGASYVRVAPEDAREAVLVSCAAAFRAALKDVGIDVTPDDLAYYLKLVSAAVDDMKEA